MAYFSNRLNEALAKLDDIDEAIGDLMRCEKSARDPLTAAREHVGATTALLDALRDDLPHHHPMTSPDLTPLAETDEDEKPCEEAA